ncbi:hypothetical protein [Actinokineospora pegani]|uniref:hypothetical protein n=1 Tax=Actinokineospora pegani TaxID=2654637 RepID=UPI0012EAD48A|nr:hypothetical protein [Actinokineospora pegani]
MGSSKKNKGVFGLLGAAASATSAISGLRTARADNDKLALVNALGSALVALTAILIAVRSLRGDK